MTLLVITNRPLGDKTNGYDARVWQVCQALSRRHKLILLSMRAAPTPADAARHFPLHHIFSATQLTAPLTRWRPSPRRHLRLSEEHFLPWGYGAFLREVSVQIDQLCARHAVQGIVVFGVDLLSLVKRFRGEKMVLLDVCDSMALTLLRAQQGAPGWRERLALTRWRKLEGDAPACCDHVVTINGADTATLRALSGGRTNLSTLPNGVDPLWLGAYRAGRATRRGVAFWGNLDFAPNRDAMDFFYHAVFLPFLRPAGIELCVAGGRADAWLRDAARAEPLLRLTGYVENLPALLSDYPIMVNPMRIGSGLKNKVLEAFACGLTVVSTALGIEAIEGAAAGTTHVQAESAADFYQHIDALLAHPARRLAIEQAARAKVLSSYTWDTVGAQWCDLVEQLQGRAPPAELKAG